MNQTIIVGTNTLLSIIKTFYQRGEITRDQYDKCKKRNKNIIPEKRKDIIMLK